MFQKLYNYMYNKNTPSEKAEKPKFQYALNQDEKEQLKHSEDKPQIVVLYDKAGGTTYCDQAISYIESKGIEVTPVTPEEGLSHPAFKGKVNGIYLPGGPNVAVDSSDPRTKFEGELVELAHNNDVPLMGICRGEQTMGHHNGYKVKDIPEDQEQHQPHYDHWNAVYKETENPNYNNKVVVGPGSQLYDALQHIANPIVFPV